MITPEWSHIDIERPSGHRLAGHSNNPSNSQIPKGFSHEFFSENPASYLHRLFPAYEAQSCPECFHAGNLYFFCQGFSEDLPHHIAISEILQMWAIQRNIASLNKDEMSMWTSHSSPKPTRLDHQFAKTNSADVGLVVNQPQKNRPSGIIMKLSFQMLGKHGSNIWNLPPGKLT